MDNLYNRRECLELIVKSAEVLALSPLIYPVECESNDITLEQVKIGKVLPQNYFQNKTKNLPQVLEYKRSGMLRDVIYEPIESQIQDILENLFLNKAFDKKQFIDLVRDGMNNYRNARDKKSNLAYIIPIILFTFGQKIPMYIIIKRELFNSKLINNDADVKSAMKHELNHVEDWYNGIRIRDLYIAYYSISPETFRIEFLENLMELRSEYIELEEIFKETVETGKSSVSINWFYSRAANYLKHWNFISKNPTTDLEKRTRDLQLKEFDGIIPEESNNDILIKFNLFGEKNIAKIKRVE